MTGASAVRARVCSAGRRCGSSRDPHLPRGRLDGAGRLRRGGRSWFGVHAGDVRPRPVSAGRFRGLPGGPPQRDDGRPKPAMQQALWGLLGLAAAGVAARLFVHFLLVISQVFSVSSYLVSYFLFLRQEHGCLSAGLPVAVTGNRLALIAGASGEKKKARILRCGPSALQSTLGGSYGRLPSSVTGSPVQPSAGQSI